MTRVPISKGEEKKKEGPSFRNISKKSLKVSRKGKEFFFYIVQKKRGELFHYPLNENISYIF